MICNNHRIHTGLAVALAASAIVPAGASARLDLNPPARTALPAPAPAQTAVPVAGPVRIVHMVRAGGGFDWGDAGIGAVGGVGLSLALVGTGAAVKRRGDGQPHRAVGAIG